MTCRIRLSIDEREPLAGAMTFGDVGAYERLSGTAHFAIDPKAAAYRNVVDLALAATNAAGEVEFEADFCLLKPIDMGRGNRRILFDVVNRGNVRALQFFNDAEPTNAPSLAPHAGNGFLMRRGYTLVALAWQGDILPGIDRMSMRLPIAGSAQAPVTGLVRMEHHRRSRRCRERAVERQRLHPQLPRHLLGHTHGRVHAARVSERCAPGHRPRRLAVRAHRREWQSGRHAEPLLAARRLSARAGSTSSFIPRGTRSCSGWASAPCAIF